MVFIKRFFCVFMIVGLFMAQPVLAASDFIVRNIEIQGNQRVSNDTIFSYLPIHDGQRFSAARGDATIQTLYNTGFFSNVQLLRSGDTVIIKVKERPTIGRLSITGNKAIKTKDLLKVLKKMNIIEGSVYDSSKLNELKQEIGRAHV